MTLRARTPLPALLLPLLLAPALFAGDDELADLKQIWPDLGRDSKVRRLMRLGMRRSPDILAQCEVWLKREKDPVVRGQVARVVAAQTSDDKLRSRAERVLAAYVKSQLAERQRREDGEFADIHGKHREAVPPGNVMKAGADWEDPYDERRRKLPTEIREERLHMREVIAGIESTRSKALRPALMAIFEQHHDPEVLVRVIQCFGAWRDWKALVPMADLCRIQQFGREIGGGDVIGTRRYEKMRLKWDVYKDLLWWSRPEYVPRIIRHVGEAASTVTGARIRSARELDTWLLANEAKLRKRGVVLSAAFKARARISQR